MKSLLLLFATYLIVHFSLAQNTDYYNRMNHVFGAIDKAKVTTGLLKEFGVRINHVENYAGSINSTNWVDQTQWQSLYQSLYSMRVGTTASMTAPPTVYAHLESQQAAAQNLILLAAQYYTYQQYKSNAYSNGDVIVSNDRIYDVAGRNPYETKTAFAVTPVEYHLEGNTFSFKLQSNMIYTNTTKTLSSVQVDFGNGQGYQTISLNAVKNVTYSSGGEKEMKVKFVYSGGPTLYSHSKLYVDYIPSTSTLRFSGSGITTQVITGAAFQGATATGDITIETAGTDGILDKPLIVVEGFDPFDDTDYFDFINDRDVGGINVDLDPNPSVTTTLNDEIESKGYDLVFVNYRNGTDFIQRNAFMVEAVIEWVNNNKTGSNKNVVMGMSMGGLVARYALRHMETTGRTHDTKLYISHDAPHQGANVPLAYQGFVRHLVAESIGIPVFFSIFDINVLDFDEAFPALRVGLDIVQSPAAQQMLIYQLQGVGSGVAINNSSAFGTFSTEYRNLGYPSQGGIKNIAISNGSECGTPLDFAPYATLANVNANVDLPFLIHNITYGFINALSLNPIKTLTSVLSTNTDIKAELDLKALPSQQSKQIYKGKIYIKKTVLGFIHIEEQLINQKTINSGSNMLPLDNASGGVYDINQFITLPPALAQILLEPRFNFIPTHSSLDIGRGTQQITTSDLARVTSPLNPPSSPKNTPFDNFFTNPTISENHIQFTLDNGIWLLDELQGNQAFYSCVSTCANPPSNVVSGSSLLCDVNKTYSIPNIPSGTNVSWSVSPTSLFAVDVGLGNSFTTRATSSSSRGQGTITASINSGGTCGNIQVSKTVWVGKPQYTSNISGPTLMTPGLQSNFSVSPANGSPTNYQWITPSGCYQSHCWNVVYGQGLRTATIQAGNQGNNQRIDVRAYNACGYDARYIYVNVTNSTGPCGGSLLVYPNPSLGDGGVINIKIPPPCDLSIVQESDGSSTSGSSDTKLQVSEASTTQQVSRSATASIVIIRNLNGDILYENSFMGEMIALEDVGLEPGLYIVELNTNGRIYHEGLVIKE